MRVFDLVGGAFGQRPGTRVAVIGSCRVNDPFEALANCGRAVRVWANIQSAPHTFGEALQIVKFTVGDLDIPRSLQPFIFHPPETEPVRTPADKRILESIDAVFVEISERRELFHDPYYFQINGFYREFVSKYGAPLLAWYRAFSLGEPIGEDLITGALEKLNDRGPEERKVIEAVLRRTRIRTTDVESALQAFEGIRFDRSKRWILVSHFLVPGLGGTQMKDRAELIDLVRKVAAHNSITMYDPTELLVRHGREVALESDGRDIYHYHRDFNITVADALLQAAGLMTAPSGAAAKSADAPAPSDPVSGAAEQINNMLLQLHRDRVTRMGVDESGLYAHYKMLLDQGRIASLQISSLANLIVGLLPRFDAYHVLRAGLGELAFVLATTGLRAVGFDQNPRRFAAMTAGLEALCDSDQQLARRLAVGRAAIPSIDKDNRTLAIAHHLIGYKIEQEEEVLSELCSYAAVLIDPRIFLFPRNSQKEQDAVIEAMRSRGFTQVREFPTLGLVYCARPDTLVDETTVQVAAASVDDQHVVPASQSPAETAVPEREAPNESGISAEICALTLTPPFRCDGGGAWVQSLPEELHSRTDNNDEPYRSHLRLFEDGQELGPGHARHETIRKLGGGHYSLWSGAVYFSTSDGSDPNANGRCYTLVLGS